MKTKKQNYTQKTTAEIILNLTPATQLRHNFCKVFYHKIPRYGYDIEKQ